MKHFLKIAAISLLSIIGAFAIFVFCFRKYNQHKNVEEMKIANKSLLDRINHRFGEKFQDIECLDTAGNITKLSHYKNKIIYLDFWAPHCGPCLEQAPYWESLITRFKADTAFVFVNVYIDNDFDSWKKQIKTTNKQGISLFYKSKNDIYAGKEFGVTGFPTYFFLDKEGKISGYEVRPTIYAAEKKSDIMVDWILLQAKQDVSAKDAALKHYARTTDYWAWDQEYRQRYVEVFSTN